MAADMTPDELAAEKYASHDKDCTCKGVAFSPEQYRAFLDGCQSVRTSAEWRAMERLVDAAREVVQHPEFDCANESFGTLLDELQEALVAAKSELDSVRGEGI